MAYLGKVSSDRNIARRITTSLTPSSTTFLRYETPSPSPPLPLSLCAHTFPCLPFLSFFLFFFYFPLHTRLLCECIHLLQASHSSITFAHLLLNRLFELYCEQRTKKIPTTSTTHDAHDGPRSQLGPPVTTGNLFPKLGHGASTICGCQSPKYPLHHG
jgi:hypothetical protein